MGFSHPSGGTLRAFASSLPTFRDHARVEASLDLSETYVFFPPSPVLGERQAKNYRWMGPLSRPLTRSGQ